MDGRVGRRATSGDWQCARRGSRGRARRVGEPASVSQPSPKSDRKTLAAKVIADLLADKPVRVELPGGGRLSIERRLPLLCVYRRTSNDAGTEQLLSGEPAYIIVPEGEHAARKAFKLMRAVVEHLAKEFGSFLVIELWSSPRDQMSPTSHGRNGDGELPTARFEI